MWQDRFAALTRVLTSGGRPASHLNFAAEMLAISEANDASPPHATPQTPTPLPTLPADPLRTFVLNVRQFIVARPVTTLGIVALAAALILLAVHATDADAGCVDAGCPASGTP